MIFYIAGHLRVLLLLARSGGEMGSWHWTFFASYIKQVGILHGFADIPDRQQNVMTVL